MNSNLFIVTGGPGSGKTTLLMELEKRGFLYIPEVARKIIQEQIQQHRHDRLCAIGRFEDNA